MHMPGSNLPAAKEQATSILLVSKSHTGDVTVSVNPGPGPDADFTVSLGHPGLRRALCLLMLSRCCGKCMTIWFLLPA